MKTVKAEQVETNSTSFINIVGGLLIAFAVIDFAMSFAGTNLTSFLGPVSRFSPIIFGLIGCLSIKSQSIYNESGLLRLFCP